jgi:hypothetical protein
LTCIHLFILIYHVYTFLAFSDDSGFVEIEVVGAR